MSDIGEPDRFAIKKKLELEIEKIKLQKKEHELEILLIDKKLEKIRKELESFKDIKG